MSVDKKIVKKNRVTKCSNSERKCLFRIFFLFPHSIYIFFCVVCVACTLYSTSTDCCHVSRPYLGVALLFTETAFLGCLFVDRQLRRDHYTTHLVIPATSYTLPKKELWKKGDWKMFASQQNWIFRFEYLDTRLVGTYNNEWDSGRKRPRKHA